ncbi:MAG: DNA-3-methyladenine glycosylase family protein [Gaiellaceae bacterium]
MPTVDVEPCGPFSLAVSARVAGNATRSFRGGIFRALVDSPGGGEHVSARQSPQGWLRLEAESAQGLERLRFMLALDEDHTPFLRSFRDDALLGRATRVLKGFRPPRLATVTHALLRALAGQLISAREARAIEARIIRRVSPRDPVSGLWAPPTQERLGALAPAELCRLGLAPKRAAALVRLCRSLDLERLRELPMAGVAARLERERTIGPWSVGVIALEGVGAWSHGLVGDLGLMKLCSVLRGRWVDPAETAELLDRYGDWGGLASAYLLRAVGLDLVPVPRPVAGVSADARRLRARHAA